MVDGKIAFLMLTRSLIFISIALSWSYIFSQKKMLGKAFLHKKGALASIFAPSATLRDSSEIRALKWRVNILCLLFLLL
jgi:hypothetical protein